MKVSSLKIKQTHPNEAILAIDVERLDSKDVFLGLDVVLRMFLVKMKDKWCKFSSKAPT